LSLSIRISELSANILQATLFSAVLAAFVIESYKYLQADSAQSTVDVLQQILSTLQANRSTVVDTQASVSRTQQFHPTASAVRVNSFWFAALVLSVSTSFLAILAKQWLFSFTDRFSSDIETSGRQRQFRYDSLRTWRLPRVLSSLPILLHISLLLFFAGLVDFLLTINATVAIVAAAIISVPVFIYFATHIVSLVRPTCPYRTSVTLLIHTAIDTISIELAAIVSAFVSIPRMLWGMTIVGLVAVYRRVTGRRPTNKFLARRPRKWSRVNISANILHYRRQAKAFWAPHVSSWTSPKFWEYKFISKHSSAVDARAVTRMIQMLPAAHPRRRLLAEEITHFGTLLAHKSIFKEGGAGELLAQQFRSVSAAASKGSSADQRAMIKDLSGALASLLTEADAVDTNSLVTATDGVPLHPDFASRHDNRIIKILSKTLRSGTYTTDGAFIDEDISIFSNVLRLQVYIATKKRHRDRYILAYSADILFGRLRNEGILAHAANDTLASLVNTVVYTTAVILRRNRDLTWSEHVSQRMLNALAAIAQRKPNMSMSVWRQICWGIWMCSDPDFAYDWTILVPVLKSTDTLSAPLAACLLSDASSPSLLHTILCVLEGLLYHIPDSDAEDHAEHMQLLSALVKSYPSYLAQSKSPVQDHSYTLHLLSRVARISDRLASSATNSWGVDVEQVVSNTLRFLYDVFEHLNDLPSHDQTAAFRLVIGTVCHMVRLQSYPNETHTPMTPPLFDDATPQTLADLLISVLREAEQLSPDSRLKVVLDVIGLLRRHRPGDVGDFQDAFLAHLCDPKNGAVSLLLPLNQGMHGEAANDALETIRTFYLRTIQSNVSRWQTFKRLQHRSPRQRSRYGRPHQFDLTMKSKRYARLVASLPDRNARILLTQLRTGHAPLQQHLFRIHRARTDQCPACLDYPESVHHYLLECAAYRTPRETLRREVGRSARSVRTLLSDPRAIKPLLRYIRATGRFSSFGHLEMHEHDAPVAN